MADTIGMNLVDIEPVGRLLLATVLGFLIGLEREFAGQAAGERTHALVALGAAAFSVISVTAFPGADPSRLAAGVVSGLGFLGAGMILKNTQGQVHGLTTAAGIWAVGAVGVAIGTGLYLVGVVCAAITLMLLASERVFRVVERRTRALPDQADDDPPKQ